MKGKQRVCCQLFSSTQEITSVTVLTETEIGPSIKVAIVGGLLATEEGVKEMINHLQSFLENHNLEKESKDAETLMKKLKQTIDGSDEDSVESNGITDQDIVVLSNCLELYINEEMIRFEEKSITKSSIQKNQKIIVRINIKCGFTESSTHDDGIFKCEKHGEKVQFYCEECNRWICLYDVVAIGGQENLQTGSCKDHHVVALSQLNANLVKNMEDARQKCEKDGKDIEDYIKRIQHVIEENNEKMKDLQQMLERYNNLRSRMDAIVQGNKHTVLTRENIEKMMAIQKEFEENSKNSLRALEKETDEPAREIEILQNEIKTLKQENEELRSKALEFEGKERILMEKNQQAETAFLTKEEEYVREIEGLKARIAFLESIIVPPVPVPVPPEPVPVPIDENESSIIGRRDGPSFQILTRTVERSLEIEHIDSSSWKKLYRATKNGFGANDFHYNCDDHGKTLTIIKSKNGSIFGGFTSQKWNKFRGGYVCDRDAFIFSLHNAVQLGRDAKFYYPANNPKRAIYCDPNSGPVFGGGHDLKICDNSNTCNKSYANLNCTYVPELPADLTTSVFAREMHVAGLASEMNAAGLPCELNDAKTDLCGERFFLIEEIEVFALKEKNQPLIEG